MHVFCVYFTAPPPQNVQPPAPSSSSHAPPPSSSSRYRERRTRRTHRSGGTRDDRYRSGEQEVQRQNVLHPTLVVPPWSHQRYSTVFRAETIRQQSVFKLRSWAVSKGQIKELWGTCVCGRARQTAVLCRSWEAPLVRTPFSGRRVMSVAGYV